MAPGPQKKHELVAVGVETLDMLTNKNRKTVMGTLKNDLHVFARIFLCFFTLKVQLTPKM